MGFVPHVVDINGDGKVDIISGSYNSKTTDKDNGKIAEIYVFYGQSDGCFGKRQVLGLCHIHAIASPVDWDDDGDYDLITADRSRNGVCLMVNRGSRTVPRFDPPKPLIPELPEKTAKELMITSAAAVDWDGDGSKDLVVGTEWGNIFWFRNNGTIVNPEPRILIGTSTVGKTFEERRAILKEHPWGSRLAISVCDWDGDGITDVLAGDSKRETLAEEEVLVGASKEEIEAYGQAQSKMTEYSDKSRQLREEKYKKEMSQEEKDIYLKESRALSETYRPYRELIRKYPRSFSHGYVWIFKGVK
jgi:hypothetical protein